MENRILKTARTFILVLKMNFLSSLEYRVNFLTAVFPTGMYSLGYIIFLSTIYTKIPRISGWTFDQMLLLFGVEQLFFYSSYFLYHGSLSQFSSYVRDGSFDHFLKLPIPARLFASVHDQELYVGVPFALTIILLSLLIIKMGVGLSFFQLLIFIVLVLMGLTIFYNISFTLATVAFWTVDSEELVDTLDETTDLGRYPLEIYQPAVAFLFSTIIPTILIVNVPASFILNRLSIQLSLAFITVFVLSVVVSEIVWDRGLKHYSSASS